MSGKVKAHLALCQALITKYTLNQHYDKKAKGTPKAQLLAWSFKRVNPDLDDFERGPYPSCCHSLYGVFWC